jgi:3D (Asp-Asp-Asp) domain-containing protein
MIKTYTKTILWILAAAACILVLTFQSQAAEFRMGPGDHYDSEGNIVALNGTVLVKADGTVLENPYEASNNTVREDSGSTAAEAAHPNYTAEGTGDNRVYTFEGKKYRKAASYGQHKLTGYAEEESGSAKTFSGKIARAGHTVSAPSDLPIGTVIILEGAAGPYPSRYDGLYVVEDRGGAKLENMGLIDIFCNSAAEAEHVTTAGWNYANVWIAEAVE